MKIASFDYKYQEEEFEAVVTISDIKIPHIYSVCLKSKNSDKKVIVNLHDYKKGLGIEPGINNPDQQLRDHLASTINNLIQQGKLIVVTD